MAAVPAANPDRIRLAARLRELRAATGLSGNRFAQQIGWAQSRVSRLETGTQLPTEADIRTWTQATAAGENTVAELLELLTRARSEYATWREIYDKSRGAAGRQAVYGELERQATRIMEFQPAMVPGLVQTAAYARDLLTSPGGPSAFGASEADIEAMVAERIKRQEILYQPDKQIRLVMGEAALHTRIGSAEAHTGQLDRLIAVAGLATVELGIVPFTTPMPVIPLASFAIHDNDFVLIETLTGEQRLDEPEEVATYARFFDLLRDASANGRDATALIKQVLTHQPR